MQLNTVSTIKNNAQNAEKKINNKIVEDIFSRLKAIYPNFFYSILSQEELIEMKKQWMLALIEGQISSWSELNFGIKKARESKERFPPPVGQFVFWCKSGYLDELICKADLPNKEKLFSFVLEYSSKRFDYNSIEAYPFKNKYHRYLITGLFQENKNNRFSKQELINACEKELTKLTKLISSGKDIPEFKVAIENKCNYSAEDYKKSRETGAKKLAEIKSKFPRLRRCKKSNEHDLKQQAFK